MTRILQLLRGLDAKQRLRFGNRRRSLLWGLVAATTVAIVVVVIAAAIAQLRIGQMGGTFDPRYLGAWSLTHSDGTTYRVVFNSDGTISANDNVAYQWTATPTEVHVLTRELQVADLNKPRSLIKYFFPDRCEVTLTTTYSSDKKQVSLKGNAVELRR